MVGFGANRRGGRLPSFVLIFLVVVITVLSFNYWTVSDKHARLLDELAEAHTQVKRTDAARSRLEKRNSELMVQVDGHLKQIDQKAGEFTAQERKLQACEAQARMCRDDKAKMEGDVTAQTSEIKRLREQLNELRQEFIKQEEQLREVKGNSTYLEKKLEYESLQCGRQIAQLKEDYEDKKKKLVAETSMLKQSLHESHLRVAAVEAQIAREREAQIAKEREAKIAKEHDAEAAKKQDVPVLKAGVGKLAIDAGMPGIEDSEVGKHEEMQFALKKPAITRSHAGHAAGDGGVKDDTGGAGAGAGPNLPKAGGPLPGAALEQAGAGNGVLQPPPPALGQNLALFDKEDKAGAPAEKLGEGQRQPGGPAGGVDGLEVKAVVLPPPPNPVQVLPNPMELPHVGAAPPAQLPLHRQNDEDRELQGDRPVDYRKRRQPIDIL